MHFNKIRTTKKFFVKKYDNIELRNYFLLLIEDLEK